ncbi:MAG: hypothetical protein F6K62_05400 [Sphaerospermopsis sp. SIO1G2]|nr:hypothetical protein [Sphaerospermopsis sp. SIO1G2]
MAIGQLAIGQLAIGHWSLVIFTALSGVMRWVIGGQDAHPRQDAYPTRVS